MKMASKKEDYLKNEDDLKNSDNLKNEDDLKIKTTSKIMSGGGLSFQAMFAAPNTSKSCIWHSSIAIWNYSGSGRVGSGRSNSDYKAISASQQSWSLGLAELGKIMLFLLATNVVASRPPERRPTGMPHARAKMKIMAMMK